MPQTLTDIIRRSRQNLEEPSYPSATAAQQSARGLSSSNTGQRFWDDTELTDWINDAARDIARRTEDLESINTTLSAMSGVQAYPLMANVVRIHRVEYTPTGSTQVYSPQHTSRDAADQFIGWNPAIQSFAPLIYWIFGTAGSSSDPLTIYFYPVFSSAGTIKVWYYRLPNRIADPAGDAAQYNVAVEIPEGWDDAAVLYVTAKALQKARNPLWTDRQQEYEAKIAQLIDVSRRHSDAMDQVINGFGGNTGYWNLNYLYGWDY